MAELYDGEMWLPSDIFPVDELTSSHIFSYYSPAPHSSTADCDLLRRNLLHPPYNSHYYRPAVQRGSLLQGSCGGAGGNRMTVLEAVHNYNQFVRPVQLQVERLRREEMMLRILRGRNLGIPGGVLKYEDHKRPSRGEYRGKGTGVFIPRPVPSNIGIAAPTTTTREDSLSSSFGNFSMRADEKDMKAHFPSLAGARTKQENQVHSHINSGIRLDTRKEVDCHYQLPPELALPQEWTY